MKQRFGRGVGGGSSPPKTSGREDFGAHTNQSITLSLGFCALSTHTLALSIPASQPLPLPFTSSLSMLTAARGPAARAAARALAACAPTLRGAVEVRVWPVWVSCAATGPQSRALGIVCACAEGGREADRGARRVPPRAPC